MSSATESIYGKLPGQWRLVEVGELVRSGRAELQTGPFGTMLHASAYRPLGTPVVAVQHIGENHIVHNDLPRVDDETRKRLSRYQIRSGDILFGRKGAIDRRALIGREEDGWLQGSDCIRLRFSDEIDSTFVSYVLGSQAYREWINRNAQGATMPSLNQEIISRIPLPLAPLREQRAIAHILGTLDDKIELNQQMNESLEAMARAIFKSWFVDFDPVRAKTEGRAPGLPKPLAALFPDSFEDSELGEIPKGWRVGLVRDVADINTWTLDRTDPLPVIDYIEISEVMRGEIANIVRYERGSEPSRARRRLKHGDTVLSTVRPDRGAHFLCLDPRETLIASTGFAVLSPREGDWAFLYAEVTRRDVGEELGRLADGGAYPAVRPEVVGALPLVLPANPDVRMSFHRWIEPSYKRVARNRAENRTLAALRDALLPRLISGELRVKDAEKIAAVVV